MKLAKGRARRRRMASPVRPPAGDSAVFSPGLRINITNYQRRQPVDTTALRQIGDTLLRELLQLENAEIGVSLIAAPRMRRLNETFLKHEGSTDVITFDYSQGRTPNPGICGDVIVCVDEAVLQARRFRTTWQSEVIRYLIHGILHLLGYSDHRSAARRAMKRQENRLLRLLGTRFPLSRLARKSKLRP